MRPAGHGEKQSRSQQKAILAILTAPTLAAAAKKAGVSKATLLRWLKESSFQAALAEETRCLFEPQLARLKTVSGRAINALNRALRAPSVKDRIHAADALLKHSLKASSLQDMAKRLEAMETELKKQGRIKT